MISTEVLAELVVPNVLMVSPELLYRLSIVCKAFYNETKKHLVRRETTCISIHAIWTENLSGQKHGLHTTWSLPGKYVTVRGGLLESESNYRNGKLNGRRREWRPTSDKYALVGTFNHVNDCLHGIQLTFREFDGLLYKIELYWNGQLLRLWHTQ